ncbi:MAG: GNAT family N-acetyltransferase, partial [Candidatus Aenigmarchaeota archaeon]|nr:GNAT family N-acetyltransferase [Candidatus Aenigmarchaeota archaeon]
ISVISNPEEFKTTKSLWNRLADDCSSNPLFLSSYILDRMKCYSKEGWSPLLLHFSKGDELIGSVPLRVKRTFGLKFAKLLLEPDFSPDFVFRKEYRRVCTEEAIRFLFNTLGFHYLDFTLPVESKNRSILKRLCESQKISFHESFGNAHRMIKIKCTWDEYVKQRRRKTKKKFRSLENRLNKEGIWKIVSFRNDDITTDTYKKILDIENLSWKEKWRQIRRKGKDEHYPMVWNASKLTKEQSLNYHWILYFLELNNTAISFAIVLQYKDTSVMLKTTFDDRYKELSPGTVIMNAVIRDQFEEKETSTIEMMTDLDVVNKWDHIRLPRSRIILSNNRLLPRLVYHCSKPTFIKDYSISGLARIIINSQAMRRFVADLREV